MERVGYNRPLFPGEVPVGNSGEPGKVHNNGLYLTHSIIHNRFWGPIPVLLQVFSQVRHAVICSLHICTVNVLFNVNC